MFLDKFKPHQITLFCGIGCAFLGILLGICLASLDYYHNIEPYQLSGSDLQPIVVYQGDQIIDTWMPEKMRKLYDAGHSIKIPIEVPCCDLNNVLDMKFDSLESVNGKFYSFDQ